MHVYLHPSPFPAVIQGLGLVTSCLRLSSVNHLPTYDVISLSSIFSSVKQTRVWKSWILLLSMAELFIMFQSMCRSYESNVTEDMPTQCNIKTMRLYRFLETICLAQYLIAGNAAYV